MRSPPNGAHSYPITFSNHVLQADVNIGKGRMDDAHPLPDAFRAAQEVRRGFVIYEVRCDLVVQHGQIVSIRQFLVMATDQRLVGFEIACAWECVLHWFILPPV